MVTHARALEVSADGATIRDELTGETTCVRARSVVNAAGVWAGQVVDGLTLRPSRGTHLVLRGERLAGVDVAVSAPVPGSLNRFVFTLPQPDGLVYVGLTDEPAEGEVPDVPSATEAEIDFLLETMSSAFEAPLTRDDVVGTYAGLRPLLSAEGSPDEATADLSRKHAVLTSDTGVVTVVGGKLTTYRRMAEDAVDAVVAGRGLRRARVGCQPCRTRDLPLVGAAPRSRLADRRRPRPTGPSVRHRGARRARRRRRAHRPGRRARWPPRSRTACPSPAPSCCGASPTRVPSTPTTCSSVAPASVWWPTTEPPPRTPPTGRWSTDDHTRPRSAPPAASTRRDAPSPSSSW